MMSVIKGENQAAQDMRVPLVNALTGQSQSRLLPTASHAAKFGSEAVEKLTGTQPQWIEELADWAASVTDNDQAADRLEVADKISVAYIHSHTELSLAGLQFGELPYAIGELTQLRWLDLSGSSVTTLPDVVQHLHHLAVLGLSRTRLSALPDVVFTLKNLQTLGAASTQITAISERISELSRLEVLSLHKTPIGVLPNNIGSLSALTYLDLSETQLTELPESIGGLKNLQSLSLAGAPFKRLTRGVDELLKLEFLDLSCTDIQSLEIRMAPTQTLAELNKGQPLPSNTEELSLWISQTYGVLPKSLTCLPKLRMLKIDGTPFGAFLEAQGQSMH